MCYVIIFPLLAFFNMLAAREREKTKCETHFIYLINPLVKFLGTWC